jgi:Tol biopolymer transport system component
VAVVPAGRLVFDRFHGSPEGPWLGTFVADSDGANPYQVTSPKAADGGLTPIWSPDGKHLLVNIWVPPGGPLHPAIANADGTGVNELKPKGLAGDDLACTAWSPDSTMVMCSRGSTAIEREGIYRMQADATGLAQLTASPFHHVVGTAGECGGGDSRAVLSPDGRQFAFIRQACGTGPDPSSDETGAILVGNIDGSGLHVVVAPGGVRTHAGSQLSWSPDGQAIVFGTQELHLRTIHPDGTGVADVSIDYGATGITGVLGPAWSPDGTRIVFSTFSDGTLTDLFIVAPDGTQLVKVVGTTRGGSNANWGTPAKP